MSEHSNIEWTNATWNVVTGCTRVSDGCDHCYIERTPPFRMTGRRFDKPSIGGTTGVTLHPNRIATALRWRKPRRIFVCSLADLFHDKVPVAFLDEVFGVMAVAHQLRGHVFQILTKRPARMRSYLRTEWPILGLPGGYFTSTRQAIASAAHRWAIDRVNAGPLSESIEQGPAWPLPGVWLGVSVENQQWADIRIPILLDTPAAVRWVSAEPLLGPLDLSPWFVHPIFNPAYRIARCGQGSPHSQHVVEHGPDEPRNCPGTGGYPAKRRGCLDWIVCGGESGPGARPMHPDWARSLRDECVEAGVPYFFKQWGEYGPLPSGDLYRVGKKAAGRLLDGRTWDEYPQVVA
jgi:protein gp37